MWRWIRLWAVVIVPLAWAFAIAAVGRSDALAEAGLVLTALALGMHVVEEERRFHENGGGRRG